MLWGIGKIEFSGPRMDALVWFLENASLSALGFDMRIL